MAQEKEYTGTFTLGATTPTYDLESEPGILNPLKHSTEADTISRYNIYRRDHAGAACAFCHQSGWKRLYELARKGKEVKAGTEKNNDQGI